MNREQRIALRVLFWGMIVIIFMSYLQCLAQEIGYTCQEIRNSNNPNIVDVNDGWHLMVRSDGKEKELPRPNSRKDCIKKGEKWMDHYIKQRRKEAKK